MSNQQIVQTLKAGLFDLSDSLIGIGSRKAFAKMVTTIQSILNADHFTIFYDEEKLERQLYFDTVQQPVSYLLPAPPQQLLTFFEDDNAMVAHVEPTDITLPIPLSYPHNILMKVHVRGELKGFVLLSYREEVPFNNKTFLHIQQTIEKFMSGQYSQFQQQFRFERNRVLMQLSAKLHSVHSTTDVLKRVYRIVQLLYPKFRYRFLMSHEYDNASVPLSLIEYNGDTDSSLGTIAFINNELQVKHDLLEKQTIIYSPLNGRQGVYGVFEITIPELINLDESELQYITETTSMIGRAIERTTLYQSSNQLVTDLQFINIASRDLNSNLDRREITSSVRKHIAESCQTEQVGIILFSSSSKDPGYSVLKGSSDYFRTEEGNLFIAHIFKELQAKQEPIFSGNYKVSHLDNPFHSIMVIPMWAGENLFGAILVAHESPYYFSFDKYKFVQSFVQHASLAYMNAMLKEKLRLTAITDYLTKLYLRNHLDKTIEEHMRDNRGGTFIILDVDDFKSINDTYGHYVGDSVLVQVANVLKAEIQQDEIAARWGGEEFAVYLPQCEREYAQAKANAIRKKVGEQTDPRVTLSVGIAIWCNNDIDSIEKLFIQADNALYKAKTTGKNRVVFSDYVE